MTVKTGVDIIEVKRIQEAIEKQGDKFLNYLYTPKEIEYCSKSGKMMYQHYAARFAAKEAIFKAVSTHLKQDNKEHWRKIEITNNQAGKPIANIEKLGLQDIDSMDLSISHIQEYAVATFTIIFNT